MSIHKKWQCNTNLASEEYNSNSSCTSLKPVWQWFFFPTVGFCLTKQTAMIKAAVLGLPYEQWIFTSPKPVYKHTEITSLVQQLMLPSGLTPLKL